MKSLLFIIFVIILTSCGLECIDKKTGKSECSQTVKESKRNKVFLLEMLGSNNIVTLDSIRTFKIVNSWVENKWHYDCIHNRAVLKKDSSYQFIIDADFQGEALHSEYYLMNKEMTSGNMLNAQLCFDYNGEDTLSLILAQKDTSEWKFKVIEQIEFIKKVSR